MLVLFVCVGELRHPAGAVFKVRLATTTKHIMAEVDCDLTLYYVLNNPHCQMCLVEC